MKIVFNPRVLLSVKTYIDLVVYIFAAALGAFTNIFECIIFWLLPFKHSLEYYNYVRDSFEKQVKERNIEFEITDKKEYEY